MAFNFATVCMKDDPTTTPEDVVNLKMHMDKQRLIMHEGMQISRFTVFSDYDKQDFVDASGNWGDDPNNHSPARFEDVKPLPEGVDPSFAIRSLFKNSLFGKHDKTIYCHPRCVPVELTASGKSILNAKQHSYLYAFHQDNVEVLPENARLIGSTEMCKNFIVEFKKGVIGFQGHPEFDAAYMQGLLDINIANLDDSILNCVAATLSKASHSGAVRRFIIQYIKNNQSVTN